MIIGIIIGIKTKTSSRVSRVNLVDNEIKILESLNKTNNRIKRNNGSLLQIFSCNMYINLDHLSQLF